MQALKALVIFLGLLIAVGVAVVAVTIYKRASGRLESAASSGASQTFGKKQIPLPAGAHVEDVAASDGRLVVTLRLGDGSPRIVIVDMTSGDTVGELDFPAASPQSP